MEGVMVRARRIQPGAAVRPSSFFVRQSKIEDIKLYFSSVQYGAPPPRYDEIQGSRPRHGSGQRVSSGSSSAASSEGEHRWMSRLGYAVSALVNTRQPFAKARSRPT